MFDWIADQRRDRLAGFDLKLQYLDEVRDHWDGYVGKMESLLAGVEGSDSLVDKTLAAEYRAAARKGKLQLQSVEQRAAARTAERKRAALKK